MTPLQQRCRARAEEFIKKFNTPAIRDGHVTVAVCIMCGDCEWRSSDASRPAAVEAVPMRAQQCAECQAIYRRHPELYRWLVEVLSMHIPPEIDKEHFADA